MNGRLWFAGMACAVAAVTYMGGCTVKKTSATTEIASGSGGATSGPGSTGTGVGGATGSTKASSTIASTGMTVASSSSGSGGLSIKCNPVTNEKCTGGAECDIDADMSGTFLGFNCFKPGAGDGAKPCDKCDPTAKTYCQGTMTCGAFVGLENKCFRYCCNDMDCGTGKCNAKGAMGDLFAGAPGLGVCTTSAGPAASCDAPATSKSMGSCIKINM